MAQADSVPTAIQVPITGAIAKASTKPSPADRRHHIPGSFMCEHEPGFAQRWRGMRAEVERDDLPLGVATRDPNRRWYEATGRTPIAAFCYWTAAIYLGWWPWSFLLLLLLFPIGNRRVRFYAFPTTRSNGPVQPRGSRTRGSSL
jgi:hypothetical protein